MTRRLAALLCLMLAALPLAAQTTDPPPDETVVDPAADPNATADGVVIDPNAPSTLPQVNAPPARFVSAPGGTVRVLDKLTGTTKDLNLEPGAAQTAGRLGVVLDDCRYPADDPTSESVAHLVVTVAGQEAPVFSGWMLASSPALSALDHPRYDVWVLGCDVPEAAKTTSGEGSGG